MRQRYPIGKFAHECDITSEQHDAWIRDIEQASERLAAALQGDDHITALSERMGW